MSNVEYTRDGTPLPDRREREERDQAWGIGTVVAVLVVFMFGFAIWYDGQPREPKEKHPRGIDRFGAYVVEQAEIRDEEYRRDRGE